MTRKQEQEKIDKKWMRRCLVLARKGEGLCAPNPMVGSVIVDKKGNKIAEGFHKGVGTLHGEQSALANAKASVKGGTLYVNLEPCRHTSKGRYSCAQAILDSGLKRVVFGARDPIKGHGGGASLLSRKGIDVSGPVSEQECLFLNRGFIKHSKVGTPYVIGKVAMSLNGSVSTATGESKWITSEESRADGRRYRTFCDGILVGVNTVLQDNPKLTARSRTLAHDPVRIVLDSRLRTPVDSKLLPLLSESKARVIIACVKGASEKKIKRLESKGADVWQFTVGRKNAVPLKMLLKKLAKSGVLSLLVEGGPKVLGGFLGKKLVDELVIYTSPKLIVGGKNWLHGSELKKLNAAPHLTRYGPEVKIGQDRKCIYRMS